MERMYVWACVFVCSDVCGVCDLPNYISMSIRKLSE